MNLIISIDDLKTYTGISDTFDEDVLSAFIDATTDLNTQGILGTALTDKLVTDYNAGTLAGVYLELYDSSKASVKKMVIWQTYVHNLGRLAYKVQNSGISKSGGDLEAESVTRTELADLESRERAKMVSYENRVKKYLVENQSSFPELADTTPEYLQENTTPNDGSQGMSTTPNLLYNNF